MDGATERAVKHGNIATYLAVIHIQLQHLYRKAGRPMGSGVGVKDALRFSEE
jgi:hypothetical protein